MAIAFVMPCLNEERLLAATAASLGFGTGSNPPGKDVYLVMVDNGSTDATLRVMEAIASASRPGAVRIALEPERGFVPPRRRGAFMVRQIAEETGTAADRFLILQADADTVYREGYARWMWNSLDGREGFLLEGALRRSEDFDEAHRDYRELERSIDAGLEAAGVADDEEVVVDDKACGYLLSDYLRWGGHFREYDAHGSEVHAETTRLFLRARLAHGARKLRVNPAQATASRRRIEEDPALHFATTGFPREAAWIARWRERHPGSWSVDEFARSTAHPEVCEACFYRRAHDIALFALLPWVVRRAEARGAFEVSDERAARLLSLVPEHSAEELAASPALAITAVLDAIEQHPEAF